MVDLSAWGSWRMRRLALVPCRTAIIDIDAEKEIAISNEGMPN